MGIALEDDTDDFIKNWQEVFRTAYDIASRKIREAGQKQKKYYDKGRAKKASDILSLGTQVLVKQTGFQERHKIADVWEDDVYVITDQPIKIFQYTQLKIRQMKPSRQSIATYYYHYLQF